ncbi:unnamed protein product, partial [Effrenium voratum]
ASGSDDHGVPLTADHRAIGEATECSACAEDADLQSFGGALREWQVRGRGPRSAVERLRAPAFEGSAAALPFSAAVAGHGPGKRGGGAWPRRLCAGRRLCRVLSSLPRPRHSQG